MVQDIMRTKYIIFYWLEKTAINSYSENGQGRKRDRQQFETDFDALTQPSEKRKMSDATKEKPKFKLGVTNNHKTQSDTTKGKPKIKFGVTKNHETQYDTTKEKPKFKYVRPRALKQFYAIKN